MGKHSRSHFTVKLGICGWWVCLASCKKPWQTQAALSRPGSSRSPLSSWELRSHGKPSLLPAGRCPACWGGQKGTAEGKELEEPKNLHFPPSAQLLASLPSEPAVPASKGKFCVNGKTASWVKELCIFQAVIASSKMCSGSGLLSFFMCFCS